MNGTAASGSKRGVVLPAAFLPADRAAWAKIGVFTGLIMGQILPQRFIDMVLPAIFRDAGLDLKDFWIFSLAAAPYWFKWLWAPYVDGLGSARIGGRAIGRRKSVIIPCTLLGAAVYASLTFAEPTVAWAQGVIAILFLAAFVMSVQDVAVDGYTVEGLKREELGPASAIFSVGARFADILSVGGLLLMYEAFGWEATMAAAALLLVLFSMPAFVRREPPPPAVREAMTARNARPSIRAFLARKDSPYVLGFVILLTFGLFMTPVMVATFLRDLGFAWSEIALAIGVTQTVGAVVGGLGGSWLLARFGFRRAAMIAAVAAALAPMGYVLLSRMEDPGLAPALGAVVAYIVLYSPLFVIQSAARYRWVSQSQAGADFTIQSSCFFIGLNAALAFAGFAAGNFGWTAFFLIAAVVLGAVAATFALMVERVNEMADAREARINAELRAAGNVAGEALDGAAAPASADG